VPTDETPAAPQPPGDSDAANFRTLKRSDLDLLRSAATRGWKVPDVIRSEAIYQLAKIVATATKPRDKLRAAQILAAFDRCDQREEMIALARAKFEHETRPPEVPDDDYDIDLSAADDDAAAEGDPALEGDRPPA
jgi:hypothetical protein